MVMGLPFNKTTVYVGFCGIDRDKARAICKLVHKLGYDVIAVEHNVRTQRQFQRNVRSLEEADVAITIVSPESLNSAHIWREVATCNTASKPLIPVVVESFQGVMPLTDIFDATLSDSVEDMESYYRDALGRRIRKARGMKSRYEEKAATQLMKELDERKKRATRLNNQVSKTIRRKSATPVRAMLGLSAAVVAALGLVAQIIV